MPARATPEHATLDGGLRLKDLLGAHLAVGWHVGEAAHLEAAWLQARWAHGDALVTLGAGRSKVPMGAVLSNGGDYDRLALVPLVKRASLNVDWLDDGIVAAWRSGESSADGATGSVEFGLWRGIGFPGGGDLPPVPTLHAQVAWADLEFDAFVAWLRPDGRGTYASDATNPGHTHDVPDCNKSLSGLVCFDGKVQVYGASLSWAPHEVPMMLTAAALLRQEQGSLYSQSGDVRYDGSTVGGWFDVSWALRPHWQLAGRFEALRATQDLAGPGASLIAAEARLVPNQPAYRLAAALAYRPTEAWRLNVELGADRHADETNPYIGARIIWWAPWLVSGSW